MATEKAQNQNSSKTSTKNSPMKNVAAATQAAKEKMSQVLTQAKESLKVLETLEREAVAKAKDTAKNLVKMPKVLAADERVKMTNERIWNSLRKLGVASQSEVETLREQVAQLQAQLGQLQSSGTKKSKASAAASNESSTQS